MRSLRVYLGVLALGVPASALAAIPAIEHDPIGCVVAGEFPRLDACFTPIDNVTRPRAYFKSETGTAWYWVDFKRNTTSAAPAAPANAQCYNAVLPRPTNKITGLVYYLEVANPQYEVSRLDDKHVRVVPEKGGCRKDEPIAATVPNAAVVVGAVAGAPAIPAGFAAVGIAGAAAGGVGAGVVAAAVVGGAGAVAGGVAVASGGGNGSNPTSTVAPTATNVVVVITNTPTRAPTPTATPVPAFNPVINAFPTEGPDPLEVSFQTCASTGQNLRYDFDFDGDGTIDLSSGTYCNVGRFYHIDGTVTKTSRVAGPVHSSSAAPFKGCVTTFQPSVTVRESLGSGGGTSTQTFTILVDDPACSNGLRSSEAASGAPRVAGTTALVGSALAQILLNGDTPLTAPRGRASFVASGRRGTNRVELRLAQGAGPGSISFDLGSTAKLVGGSLKVVAGDVTSVSGSSVTFRLSGKPGETIGFTFEVAP